MSDRRTWKLALSVGPGAMNAESFDALAAAGIREIELSSGAVDPYYSVLAFPRRSAEIASLAKEHGVNISSIHLPFGPFSNVDPSTPDPEKRAYLIRIQRELLDAAGKAGVGIAVLHPSGEPYPDDERDERIERAVEVVSVIADAAEKAGVTLALENLPRTCLGRDSAEMLRFLEAIPTLRAVFDTNHSLREDNPHFIRALGSKIVSLHVSDYDFIDEKHWLPGEGKNDWKGIIAALEDIGYEGRFLYELHAGPTYQDVAENYKKLIG
ncbi:MAG: sugar phosphate isomerase/epimerase [Clostridia bacterium]|nr:sugar phosphate isomerase/epimerase [Clostridia bacterium]